MASSDSPLLDPSIFDFLKSKLDEETQVRDTLTGIVQRLERAVASAQALLSRVYSTPRARFPALVAQVEAAIQEEVAIISELNQVASKHPYYRYNQKWSRAVQAAIGTAVYCAWLGGLPSSTEGGQGDKSEPAALGRLLTLDQLGVVFGVPTNLKDRDAFHLTLEEYLLALTELTSDLARLATNAVTLGDFELPTIIGAFVRDLFAGFQLLNLKNDILRKRADAVKYDVKRVEDVVYDLTLRGLIKRAAEGGDTEMKTA